MQLWAVAVTLNVTLLGDSSDRQRCFCRVYVFLSTSRLSCSPHPSRVAKANILCTA